MVSHAANSAATALGVCGNVLSTLMFLSSVTTFSRIVRRKSTDSFSVFPYVASFLNCVLWILYGINKKVVLIESINGIGTVLNFIYIFLFVIYSWKDRKARKNTLTWVAICLIPLIAVAFGFSFGLHSKVKIDAFGWLCVALNIAMYGSPLIVWREVVKTKSVEYLPFWLCVIIFVNSVCWLIYGILKHNIYVLIPNGLGVLGGFIQILLIIKYGNKDSWKSWQVPEPKEIDVEKGNIELPTK